MEDAANCVGELLKAANLADRLSSFERRRLMLRSEQVIKRLVHQTGRSEFLEAVDGLTFLNRIALSHVAALGSTERVSNSFLDDAEIISALRTWIIKHNTPR